MRKKKTVEQEINEFLDVYRRSDLTNLLNDILPLLELYNVDESSDWVREAVGEEDCNNVRLIRTVYLLSWFAEMHTTKLGAIKARFSGLWKRIEKEGVVNE